MSDTTAAPAPAPAPAPAAAPAPAPAAPAASAPAPAPTPAPAANWFDSFADQSLREWAAATGLPGPEAAAAKALNLEKLLGADRAGRTVVIPKDDASADEIKAFRAKLGVPADPAGYALPTPQGADPAFAQTAAKWFHEAGIPAKQAQSVAARWNEHVAAQMKAQADAEQAALGQETEQLKTDWGNAYPLQQEIARRAAVKLGIDEAGIDALQKVAGFSKVMKMFAKVGELIGEDKASGLGDATALGMTPEAARGRKAQLMADADWRKKAMNPQSAEWAEIQRLDKIIAASMGQAA